MSPEFTNEKGERSCFQPVPFVRKNYAYASITLRKNGNYHSYVLDRTQIGVMIGCKLESIDCYNVIAFIPGTDSVLKFDPVEQYREVLRSCDFWSYYQKEIPAIMLSSDGFTEHHTPQDNISFIDFEHLLKAAKLLHAFIMESGNKI